MESSIAENSDVGQNFLPSFMVVLQELEINPLSVDARSFLHEYAWHPIMEEEFEGFEYKQECAYAVAEWLVSTNSGDVEKAYTVVNAWKNTGIEGVPLFLESLYDAISAIKESQKK